MSSCRPPEFTYAAYAAMLDAAIAAGYRFASFEEAAAPTADPIILLRHDIDYDPRFVAPISRIEADRGVRATYFFQRDSRFYAAEAPVTAAAIQQVLADGHWLGQHVDATEIPNDADVLRAVESQCQAQEQRFLPTGQRIRAVSFHMPTRRPVGHLQLPGDRINTYAPIFFTDIEYASDSNQHWRGRDILHTIARRPRALQVLTHPIWWRDIFRPARAILHDLAAHLGIPIHDIVTPEQEALLGAF